VLQRDREKLAGATEGLSVMLEATGQPKAEPNMLSVIMGQQTNQEWKKAESTQSLGYNGQSAWMKRHQEKAMRDREMKDAKLREG